ncbi:MAG: L,D-transpeptidase [Deltaproteobacteria bacterium]|nr:L,D-transpeptidase [Deltaproteobacteria bacterium]
MGGDGQDRPLLGIRGFAVTVYDQPSLGSTKLGYLRVGAKVPRSAEPVGRRGCKGGWYRIEPRGHVCAGKDATTHMDDPLLRAAVHRPNRDHPLPYRYGFVRAVTPLYLRVPTAQQQFKREFKLKEHLEWFKDHKAEIQTVALGAADVPVDERGRVLVDKRLGELGREKNSAELSLGQLFGGNSDTDPWPFWLRDGERIIPNVSGFQVPEYAIFADRARRHTGLAFVGSFATSEHYLRRRFAITTDLRLAPTTKVKPDAASPFYGVELGGKLQLPLAIVRLRGAQAYQVEGGTATPAGDLKRRTAHALAGKVRKVDGEKYYLLKDGRWAFHKDIGIALEPRKWPRAARKGAKWIEVDLSDQVLVMWQGKTPVYATLVSTGRPAIGDPETTTSTPRGVFNIYSKHISATMDSDEGSGRRLNQDKEAKPGDEDYVPQRGDGVYGVTKRRGHGLFKLRDVPRIQYFFKNYAIHGAYWHDVFGIPRSHGCINLAPVDALRVFKWTEPQVPPHWHGIRTAKGTTVVIHQ